MSLTSSLFGDITDIYAQKKSIFWFL